MPGAESRPPTPFTPPAEPRSVIREPRPRLRPEGNLIIANFDRLTEGLLRAETARVIAEAEGYLRQAAGEPTADGAPGRRGDRRLSPLTALSAASAALTLEIGESGMVAGLVSAVHPERSIREEAGRQQAEIQKFADSIFSDQKFGGVREALQAIDPTTLDPQDRQRYDYYMDQFQKAKPASTPEATESERDPRLVLAEAQKEYRKNTGKTVTVDITQEEFESLPAHTRNQLKATEHDDGYSVVLNQANLSNILENSGSRNLRKQAYEAYHGDHVAENDGLVQQMADLRLEIARSQGKETWMGVQVKGLTLDTPEKVTNFYGSVKDGIVQRYQATIAKLQTLLAADGIQDQIREYDLEYYKNKLIKESYDASKITFSFEKTIRGLYNLAESLLGVKIEEIPDAPVWAPGVRAYAVRDADTPTENGKDIGTIFVDPFTRQDADGEGGKRTGGATYALRYGRTDLPPGMEETNQLPVSVAVNNFTAPGADGTEAKMTMREVEALAHEALGHALHQVLARTQGPEFAGEKLKFDTMEIVSQAFEHLVKDPRVLLQLADDGIPADVMEAFLREQDSVQQDVSALIDMRLLKGTAFDIAIHNSAEPNVTAALEQTKELTVPVDSDGHWMRVIPHWANPGYTGRYYNYLLCKATATDIVAALRQENYNPEVGSQLRSILELGGQPDAGGKLLVFAAGANTDSTA
jgi:Zn-dependent oligopeptidase